MIAPDSPQAEWSRIWLSLTQHAWTTLAIVPSEAGVDVGQIAEHLAATARLQGDRSVRVVDGTGVDLSELAATLSAMTAAATHADCTLVPVDPVAESPAAVALARAASAAVLVVRLGSSKLTPARETLDEVGRPRFIGSIVLDEASNPSVR